MRGDSRTERNRREFFEKMRRGLESAYLAGNDPPDDPSATLSALGVTVHGHAESRDQDGTLLTRIAWVDAPN